MDRRRRRLGDLGAGLAVTGQLDAFQWQAPPNALGVSSGPLSPVEDEETPRETVALAPVKPVPDRTAETLPSDPVSAGMAAVALPVPGPAIPATAGATTGRP